MDRASAVLTQVVLGKWNEIFGEETAGREITVNFNIIEGKSKNESGVFIATNNHDVCISFELKDGTRRFPIKDRSLGFRWFFAFLLFTQFRSAKEKGLPILFLFDEPASNLHAAAQQKLIDSFPDIATGRNALAYTTHSHYMIEPRWLEQTFIVTNRSDSPSGSVIASALIDDESLDIKATKYKQFVNHNPPSTDYFQPVLDRLQVRPSSFEIKRSSVILEGKSDYYICRYAQRMIGKENDCSLVPGLGAGTLGALISLHLGWGLDLIFVLDGDSAGKKEKDRYITEYGLLKIYIFTLNEIDQSYKNIEKLLDKEAIDFIRSSLGLSRSPSKKDILRFFQERLAGDNIVDIGVGFRNSSSKLLDRLSAVLEGVHTK